MVEFYLKLKLTLRINNIPDIYICWEIDNFVIKSDICRRFFINYRVTMTTTLHTSCSEKNGFVSKARVSACMYFLSFFSKGGFRPLQP